jgi:hypothetical protein
MLRAGVMCADVGGNGIVKLQIIIKWQLRVKGDKKKFLCFIKHHTMKMCCGVEM